MKFREGKSKYMHFRLKCNVKRDLERWRARWKDNVKLGNGKICVKGLKSIESK
jgi:hypothetical protein